MIDAPDLKNWKFAPGEVANSGLGDPPPDIKVPPVTNRLLAWNPVTQKEAWSVALPGRRNGGVLATGGNLVFQGEVTGNLVAYSADKGQRLWAFDGQTAIQSQPISYTVDGRQYVSVITSWRSTVNAGPGFEWDYRSQHRRVLTFALDGKASLPPNTLKPVPFADDPKFMLDAKLAQAGAKPFAVRCVICHGPGAVSGGGAPDLRRSQIPLSIDSLNAVVREGALVQNGMPKFGEMTPAELLSIQHYIRQQARAAIAAAPQKP
jgi:quinohemoprotein ethanol dehydrogenase